MTREIIEKLVDQFEQKNLAYGASAHKTYQNFGSASYAIRIHDKLQRYEQLISNPVISHGDEAIEDTLGDAITYTAMFAADLNLSIFGSSSGSDDHFHETKRLLFHIGSMSEDEIKAVSDEYREKVLSGRSLTKLITNMYNADSTPAEYVLLATHLLNLLNERMMKNASCD